MNQDKWPHSLSAKDGKSIPAKTVNLDDEEVERASSPSVFGQKLPFGLAPESGHSYPLPDLENSAQVYVILELLYGQAEFQVTVKFE